MRPVIHLAAWKEGRQVSSGICGAEGIRARLTNREEKVTCPKCHEIMNER